MKIDKEAMKDDSIELAITFLNDVVKTMETKNYPRGWVPYAVSQAVTMFMIHVEKQDRESFIASVNTHLRSVIDAEYEQIQSRH